jgi:hypothetical protein
MRSSLLVSDDVIEFQTADTYSSSDPTNVKYNLCHGSKDEKAKVTTYVTKWVMADLEKPWR